MTRDLLLCQWNPFPPAGRLFRGLSGHLSHLGLSPFLYSECPPAPFCSAGGVAFPPGPWWSTTSQGLPFWGTTGAFFGTLLHLETPGGLLSDTAKTPGPDGRTQGVPMRPSGTLRRAWPK
jgi:hypothetical protein